MAYRFLVLAALFLAQLACDENGKEKRPRRTDGATATDAGMVTTEGGSDVPICADGYADCDPAVPGCETHLASAINHCGTCNNSCPQPAHAQNACTDGVCQSSCQEGWDDCDPTIPGCETNLTTTSDCGQCHNSCDPNQICGAGGCVDFCEPGLLDCGDSCVDIRISLNHCGTCHTPCHASDDKIPVCVEGWCHPICPDGQADCSANIAGCETQLDSDPNHCGACNQVCPQGPNATATCSNSECGQECQPNTDNCDNDPETGCETDLTADPNHCGACDYPCPNPGNAEPTCTDTQCGFECLDGFADCDNDPNNGCEADLTAPETCGSCQHSCESRPGTVVECALDQCAYRCQTDFADCNDQMEDGCEADLTSPETCGSCQPCIDRSSVHLAATCTSEGCEYPCAGGWDDCNQDTEDGCETPLSSLSHCGACNNACPPASQHQTVSCTENGCEYQCQTPWADCDQDPANGCEVNLDQDPRNCTGCGLSCEGLDHADASCNGGCQLLCHRGYDDCNLDLEDGCETIPALSPKHCGQCGNDCTTLANVAVATCAVNHCAIESCFGEYYDCDEDETNGCEVDRDTDPKHCGACDHACEEGQACQDGRCGCPQGLVDCAGAWGGDPECLDTTNDPQNCGQCGRGCLPGQECVEGECQCQAGLLECPGASGPSPCIDPSSHPIHCGSCFFICAAQGEGETFLCANNTCVEACPADATNCGDACVDNAEFQSHPLHCGGCNQPCLATEWCIEGSCEPFALAAGCNSCPCDHICPEQLPQCCDYPDADRGELRACCGVD